MFFCVDLYSIELYIQSADLSIDFLGVCLQVFCLIELMLTNPIDMGFFDTPNVDLSITEICIIQGQNLALISQ